MGKIIVTIFLLICSNIFMTFAWYSHLKNLNDKPWILASIGSWSIALFEYLLQVPANRIGFQVLSLPQLKILQEVITISIFIPFSLLYMGQPIKWNHYFAMLFILGAVYFVFKK